MADLAYLVLECDMLENFNTNCNGSCNRFMVEKTSTVEECIKICKKRELCRHYIWHKPGNSWAEECWVVEGDCLLNTYRNKDSNTITGSCNEGISLTVIVDF